MSPLKQCIQCNKDFYSVRVTGKYCSDKCRKLAFQDNEVTVPMDAKNANDENAKNNANVVMFEKPEMKDYTAQELYDAIDMYPADTWIESPEFVELKRRLKSKNIETLQKEGYYVPNWKKELKTEK